MSVAMPRTNTRGVVYVHSTPKALCPHIVWAIEGFEYQPGFLYELRIREFEDPKPPADGPSTRRVLIRLVSKTPVG